MDTGVLAEGKNGTDGVGIDRIEKTGTENGSFIWVYKWWGVLPVFITTYVPFFLAANYVPKMKPKAKKIFLFSLVGLNILLLAILIPLGII